MSHRLNFASTLALAGLLASAPAAATEEAGAESPQKPRLVDLWQPGDTGKRMNIRGRVTGPNGRPLSGIEVSIMQPDGDGQWTQQYRTTLTTDAQGRYQFGSVVPNSQYCGEPHVQVTVYQDGWEYYDTSLVFENEHDMGSYYGDGTPVFLEESTVEGETILFGRHDIKLSPD